MFSVKFTLCGKETIAAAETDDIAIAAVKYLDDDNAYHVTKGDDFDAWFTVTNTNPD